MCEMSKKGLIHMLIKNPKEFFYPTPLGADTGGGGGGEEGNSTKLTNSNV